MSVETYVARAPVRVDPAGGGTDAPPFCVEHGGTVVNFGIGLHVHARLVKGAPKGPVRIVSHDLRLSESATEVGALPIDGPLKLLCGIARRMAPPWGFTLEVESALPPGTGLGSSGAVAVAVVGVFDAALGHHRSQAETAELANAIERIDLGMAGGSQDSYGAAFGGLNLITYERGGTTHARHLDVAPELVFELERRCVLVYTGEVHLSGNIHRDIKISYALPDSPTVDAMRQLARIARESAVALEAGNIERFAALLDDNWVHHRRLHPSCDNLRLGHYYEAAAPHMAGGKTCGAGGGGCILFVARDGQRRALEDAVASLGGKLYPFSIDPHGLVSYRLD